MSTENTFKRIESKRFLVTVSNLDSAPKLDSILNTIQNREKCLHSVLLSSELHESGKYHVHIFFEYLKKRTLINPKIFNYILNKQTNISLISNLKGCIEYIIKDGNYKAYNIDPYIYTGQENIIKKESPESYIMSCILDGKSINQLMIDCENKGKPYLADLTKKHKQYKSMIHFNFERQAAKSKPKFKALELIHIQATRIALKNKQLLTNEYATILDALECIIKYRFERPHKTRNLHIYSKLANMGKTSFLIFLNQHLECYYYPPIQWFSEYYNGRYHAIIWDEFTMPKDIYHFNLFFEGAPVDLQVKYSHNITKTDNPMIICCSNYSLRSQIEKYTKSSCDICKYWDLNNQHNPQDCNYNQQCTSLRSTTSVRIQEIELNTSLFNLINELKKQIK